MQQATLASVGFERFSKTTRRVALLGEMDQVMPWKEPCQLIEPVYSRPCNDGPPVCLERMLRILLPPTMVQSVESGGGRGTLRIVVDALVRRHRPGPRTGAG
jgi:hypothetical protein